MITDLKKPDSSEGVRDPALTDSNEDYLSKHTYLYIYQCQYICCLTSVHACPMYAKSIINT